MLCYYIVNYIFTMEKFVVMYFILAEAKSSILRNILRNRKKDMKNRMVFCVFFCMQKWKGGQIQFLKADIIVV